jgi:hypothetical protein
MELVASVASRAEAGKLFRIPREDVTLMDLRLGGMSGVDAIRALPRGAGLPIVGFTMAFHWRTTMQAKVNDYLKGWRALLTKWNLSLARVSSASQSPTAVAAVLLNLPTSLEPCSLAEALCKRTVRGLDYDSIRKRI